MDSIGLIAGRGSYPREWIAAARRRGVTRIICAAFEGETEPALAGLVEVMEWMHVGQLRKLLKTFQSHGVRQAVMAGQIRPKHLFDLRPDLKAMLLLARLEKRNAESLFGAIADELAQVGVTLLPATTYLEDRIVPPDWGVGPSINEAQRRDVAYGFEIAKEVSRLDIGQTVVVKGGTVLAVEAFEGTNDAIRRGAALGKKEAVVVKVSKPGQDMRFDVPVIGPQTVEIAAEAGIAVLAVEGNRTLVLELETVERLARERKLSVVAIV